MARETLADDGLKQIIAELEAHFWVPVLKTPFSTLQELLSNAKEDCPPLYESIAAFSSNLASARDLLEFPYLLIAPLLPEVKSAVALPADETGVQTDSGALGKDHSRVIEVVSAALEGAKQHFGGCAQLQLLMHQACLLIWAAIDSYCKQVFVAALNQRPALLASLYKSQQLKERFQLSGNSWLSHLESNNFNLTGKLGDIISANRDFSSPQLILDLFPIMFADLPGPKFPEPIFKKDELWILGQRRHLISHRCGVVDKEYLRQTHDTSQQEGQLLRLRGRDVAKSLGAAASFAILIYGNARYCWSDGNDPSEERVAESALSPV